MVKRRDRRQKSWAQSQNSFQTSSASGGFPRGSTWEQRGRLKARRPGALGTGPSLPRRRWQQQCVLCSGMLLGISWVDT